MRFNILELYAGTGRSVEPFLDWGHRGEVCLVDNNRYAAEVYLLNRPGANYRVLDLAHAGSSELASIAGGQVDVLLGCPPCQGFSDCGLKNSRDPRNRHVTKFEEIVRDLRPRVVAMENVPLVATSSRFARFVRALEELDYSWTAAIANAALWGSCQSRQRIILVAARSDVGTEPRFPEATHGGKGLYFSYSRRDFCRLNDDLVGMLGRTPASQRTERVVPHHVGDRLGPQAIPTVGDVIGDLPEVGSTKAARLHHKRWAHKTAVLRRMGQICEGSRWSGGKDHYSQAYGRLHRKGLARTITGFFPNAGSGRFWHPCENRALTLREAARIQGFPDSFRFMKNDSENCILVGNALDRALADLTFGMIKACLE
jgi:DNA (cytosine-5)-methyltransferase 1